MQSVFKKFRLLHRSEDGAATYQTTSADGSELLIIHADGSRLRHRIIGVDFGRTGLQDIPVVVSPVPVVEPEEPAHVTRSSADKPSNALDSFPAEPEPVTEPVDERLDRDAKMMARSVWLHGGGQRRHQMLHGIPHDVQEELLAYAVNRGWVTVSEDVVKPGSTRPIDRMPEREPLSARERRARWGPGDPLSW